MVSSSPPARRPQTRRCCSGYSTNFDRLDSGHWHPLCTTPAPPHRWFTYPYALFTLGRIEAQRGNHSSAESHLHRAIHAAELNEDRYMKAYAQRELGIVCLDAGNQRGAQDAFIQARQGFQQIDMAPEVQETEKLLVKLTRSLCDITHLNLIEKDLDIHII